MNEDDRIELWHEGKFVQSVNPEDIRQVITTTKEAEFSTSGEKCPSCRRILTHPKFCSNSICYHCGYEEGDPEATAQNRANLNQFGEF